MKVVLVLNNDQMGHGDPELGRKLLRTCLSRIARFDGLDAVVLYNAGVKLATRESPIAPALTQLEAAGIDILACGTCVGHYGLEDRLVVDRVSNMDEIVSTIQSATKVITL
jgi:selenium metabolism protein YedF